MLYELLLHGSYIATAVCSGLAALAALPDDTSVVRKFLWAYLVACGLAGYIGKEQLSPVFLARLEYVRRGRRWLAAIGGGAGWLIVSIIALNFASAIVELGRLIFFPRFPWSVDLLFPALVVDLLLMLFAAAWMQTLITKPRKIFISYRRDDSAASAARIRDRLAQAIGRKRVFMDIDNLIAGQRFDRELEKALRQCTVFIAIIGRRWVELLQQRMQSGERDYVHDEIAAALKREMRIIPVLTDRAALPQHNELPSDIGMLILHQKHDVTHERFGRDVEDLIEAIRIGGKLPQPETREDAPSAIEETPGTTEAGKSQRVKKQDPPTRVIITCTNCGQRLNVAQWTSGKITCPNCKQTFEAKIT